MYEFIIKRRPRTMHHKMRFGSLKSAKGKERNARWPQPLDEERKKPGRGMYVPADIVKFEEEVGWAAKAGGVKVIQGPVGVHITVYLYLETGGSEEGLGDTDNFAKTIFDGMKKIAYTDDYQIRHHTVNKDYVDSPAKECAVVRIGTMEEMRLPDRPADMLSWVLSKLGLAHRRETRRIVIEVDKLPIDFEFSEQGEFLKASLDQTAGAPL